MRLKGFTLNVCAGLFNNSHDNNELCQRRNEWIASFAPRALRHLNDGRGDKGDLIPKSDWRCGTVFLVLFIVQERYLMRAIPIICTYPLQYS